MTLSEHHPMCPRKSCAGQIPVPSDREARTVPSVLRCDQVPLPCGLCFGNELSTPGHRFVCCVLFYLLLLRTQISNPPFEGCGQGSFQFSLHGKACCLQSFDPETQLGFSSVPPIGFIRQIIPSKIWSFLSLFSVVITKYPRLGGL